MDFHRKQPDRNNCTGSPAGNNSTSGGNDPTSDESKNTGYSSLFLVKYFAEGDLHRNSSAGKGNDLTFSKQDRPLLLEFEMRILFLLSRDVREEYCVRKEVIRVF